MLLYCVFPELISSLLCFDMYESINLNQMIAEGKTALPIVHAEIDFLRPLFCGDRIGR